MQAVSAIVHFMLLEHLGLIADDGGMTAQTSIQLFSVPKTVPHPHGYSELFPTSRPSGPQLRLSTEVLGDVLKDSPTYLQDRLQPRAFIEPVATAGASATATSSVDRSTQS